MADPVNVTVLEPSVQVVDGLTVLAARAAATVTKVDEVVLPQFPVPPLYTTL